MSSASDDSDFLSEVAGVKPLQQDKIHTRVATVENADKSYRRQVAQSFGRKDDNFLTDGEVPPVEPEDVLSFKLDGVQPNVFKKLRQGKYPVDYHLDLHRKTVAEARNLVFQLLRTAEKMGRRSLLVTHGKGIMSNPPARLKSYVNHWLRQVDTVIGFHSAQPQHGGAGSVYVLLKKTAEAEKINQAKYR